MTRLCKVFFITVFLFAAAVQGFSQRISLISGNDEVSIDFPLGFNLVDANSDGTAYQLQSLVPQSAVTAVIRIYDSKRYDSAENALKGTLNTLNAKYEAEQFEWRNQTSSIASFTAVMGCDNVAGYALSASLPENKGTIILLTWCDPRFLERSQNYMLSFLDALNIDLGCYYEAGPITAYLYPKSSEYVAVNLKIDGKDIKSRLRANDKEASEYLIEREYDVLTLYASNNLWKDAWQRYYRMIFRDSYIRLWQVSFDIYNEIAPSCTDDTELAQKLLTWTQGFKYEREKNTSDFASLPSMMLGGGSDCDSRSMLLTVLLTAMNQKAAMMVSAHYSHAMALFVSDHPGHSYEFEGEQWLMGETTAQGLTWGKIDATQDTQTKWIFLPLP
ncbi:MAG: hypothetical protein IKQ43_07610 [Treponema sp.]|nr:hypothetical protein [Treponema sp.]MBR7079618.1 hypothetical protein [Treponema sp.]